MARIRTIKPEFPHSESMGNVSRDARLMFIMLWTIADDSGRLRGNSRMLASLLFPYDDDAPAMAEAWLCELEGQGCIHRYVVDGSSYLQILNWLSHQKIDKPTESKLPAFANPRESSRILPVGSGPKDQGSKDQRTKEASREYSIVGIYPDGTKPDAGPLRKFCDQWNSTPGVVPFTQLGMTTWKALVHCLNDPSWRWRECLLKFPLKFFAAGCGITKFISDGFVDAVINGKYATEIKPDANAKAPPNKSAIHGTQRFSSVGTETLPARSEAGSMG